MAIRLSLAAITVATAALLAWITLGFDGPEVTPERTCTIPAGAAGPAGVQPLTLTVPPQTAWQPRGGGVRFTLATKGAVELKGLVVAACFGWQTQGDPGEAILRSPQVELVEADANSMTFAAVVPDLPPIGPRWPNRLWQGGAANPYNFFSSGLVPIAAMRVQAGRVQAGRVQAAPVQAGPAQAGDGAPPPLLDVTHDIGVTSVWSARCVAGLAAVLAFVLLSLSARARGVPGQDRPVINIISSRYGYASLSQFQFIVWSFVVGVGAVYVLTLSGGLIDVPGQMLVLLGIASVTVVGARVPDGAAAAKPDAPKLAPPTTEDVSGVAVVAPGPDSLGVRWNAAQSRRYDVDYRQDGAVGWTRFAAGLVHEWCRIPGLRADHVYHVRVRSAGPAGGAAGTWSAEASGRTLRVARMPRWSDLIVADETSEIDVTRVQMMFFTLIAASFVAIRVFNSYEIPEVPEGFLELMGLSNGVYLAAKFVPS